MAVECVAGSHVAPEERFEYFWRQQGEWVEEPNRRRGGESGVQRVMGPTGRLLTANVRPGIYTAVGCIRLGARPCCANGML